MTPDLNALKDIHLPPAVSAWPPAPAWVVSALSIAVFSIIFAWFAKQLIKKIRFRRNVFLRLKAIEQDYLNQRMPGSQACYQLSIVLKQVLIKTNGRKNVAALTGPDWLNALDNEPFARIIYENEYKQDCQHDLKPLFPNIRQFIKKQL